MHSCEFPNAHWFGVGTTAQGLVIGRGLPAAEGVCDDSEQNISGGTDGQAGLGNARCP